MVPDDENRIRRLMVLGFRMWRNWRESIMGFFWVTEEEDEFVVMLVLSNAQNKFGIKE